MPRTAQPPRTAPLEIIRIIDGYDVFHLIDPETDTQVADAYGAGNAKLLAAAGALHEACKRMYAALGRIPRRAFATIPDDALDALEQALSLVEE